MERKVRLSNEEIGSVCLSLSLLLHAGTGAADSLSLMAEDEALPTHKRLLSNMAAAVDGGEPLSGAFRACGCFPAYVCGLLEVGERSGKMEEALGALSEHYEGRAALDARIRSALLYPAILLLIMLAVIVILLVYVLPVFNDVYAQLGSSLTGVAGGLLALGGALDKAMPFLCVLLGVLVLFIVLFALSGDFRDKLIALWRKKRGDKGVSLGINTARLAQSLNMGVSSGLSTDEALQLSVSLMDDGGAMQKRCEKCLELIDGGASLSKALGETELFPRSECRLLETGLRSGVADGALSQIARRMTERSEEALSARVSRVEPTLVVITAVLVGVILLSVMLPLMHIMSAIG